ncbi:hypothetical protein Q1695_008902 [Nippostrongylus brasiliensis]|nr:hypothetical protein Q1695_008902 [Nippostrongylus brasiliensis]
MSSPSRTGHEVHHIPSDVSSRISTAQVIASLSSAVRQLVDNSLDASAKTIEIRAKNNGYESVEVIDDGVGIESDNFDSLCKPHSTSKLTELNDFSKLSTLGFRGEALNALCALSSITITTRSRNAPLGTKLRFDHKGNVVDRTSVARSVGTTVAVESLFETLPVRRKEFEKTSRKEFGKVLTMVQSYAVSRPDLKFICSNTVAGKRQQHICTPGNASIRDVVVNLFGGRTDKNKMVDIVRCLPDDDVCSIYGLDSKDTAIYAEFGLTGFVSTCEHGFGRSAPDRQFIYFNQRPTEYPKICRVVNEVYQQYNRSQYPTLILNIEVSPSMIDVNVTPDKRMVFIDREKELLALVRSSLLATFHPLLGSYTSVEGNHGAVEMSGTELTKSDRTVPLSTRDQLFSLLKSNSATSSPSIFNEPQPKRSKTDSSYLTKAPTERAKTLDAFAFKPIPRENTCEAVASQILPREQSSVAMIDTVNQTHRQSPEALEERPSPRKGMSMPELFSEISSSVVHERKPFTPPLMRHLSRGFENSVEKDSVVLEKIEKIMDKDDPAATKIVCEKDVTHLECGEEKNQIDSLLQTSSAPSVEAAEGVGSSGDFLRTQQTIPFSMTTLKERLKLLSDMKVEQASQKLEFHAGISPEENDLAERELDRTLKKSDFNQMEVIGQFNKGFIIARLRDHLFLVDQHASDEKYNFERFQKKARVETQRLIHPQALDIGAVQTSVLRDNINVFEANGFGFEFSENGDDCTVPLLVSTPVLHSWQFDKSDIEEILTVVSEFPGTMYRPAKLRRIFASRACRKSVMIGTTLTTAQMRTIVSHLSTLDQPWNCPHGRPTLRHLADLRNVSC